MSSLFNAAYKDSFGSTPNDDVFSVANGMNQLQLFRLMYEKQKMENERYGQLTPMELDIKGKDAAQARVQTRPDLLEAFAKGEIGKSQEAQAKGAKSMATLGGDIESANQENSSKVLRSQVDMLMVGLDRALSTGDLSGLPPQFRNLDSVALNSIRDNLKTSLGDTPAVRGQQMVEQTKGEQHFIVEDDKSQEHFRRTEEENKNRLAVEAMKLEAKKKSDEEQEKLYKTILLKSDPARRKSIAGTAVATGLHPATGRALTEQEINEFKNIYKEDISTMDANNAARSAGKLDVPAIAGQPAVRTPSTGGGSSSSASSGGGGKKVWNGTKWVVN